MNICVPEGKTLYLVEILNSDCTIRNHVYSDLNSATKETKKAFFNDKKILSIAIYDLNNGKVINIVQRTKTLKKFIKKNMENLTK